jgi:hypothetical protein
MTQNLIDILNNVKEKFTDNSDMLYTSYGTAKEVRDELDSYMEQLSKSNNNCIEDLNVHFLPASTFQEHALQNNWCKEYMQLSEQFDSIYILIKSQLSN